jgi:hypothetical protein
MNILSIFNRAPKSASGNAAPTATADPIPAGPSTLIDRGGTGVYGGEGHLRGPAAQQQMRDAQAASAATHGNPPTPAAPARRPGPPTLEGLEGVARESAKKLGLDPKMITGFVRSGEVSKGALHLTGSPAVQATPINAVFVLRPAEREGVQLLDAEHLRELRTFEEEDLKFYLRLLENAHTAEHRKRLVESDETLRHDTARRNAIIATRLAQVHRERGEFRRTAPLGFLDALAANIRAAAQRALLAQMTAEMQVALEWGVSWAPSPLIVTLHALLGAIDARLEEGRQPYASALDAFWGVPRALLSDNHR